MHLPIGSRYLLTYMSDMCAQSASIIWKVTYLITGCNVCVVWAFVFETMARFEKKTLFIKKKRLNNAYQMNEL